MVFASAALCLAVGAHLASGEPAPPARVLLAATAAVLPLSWLLARRERGCCAVLGATVAAQVGLHALFLLVPGRSVPSWVVLSLCHGAGAPLPAGFAQPRPLVSGVGAVVAHGLAAVALAWWLRQGERATWSLLRQVVAAVVGRLHPIVGPPAGPAPAARRGPARAVPAGPEFALGGPGRRGPPSFAAAC